MMKDILPDYNVESFIEADFVTLDVIAEIDTENTNFTLEEIEQHAGCSFSTWCQCHWPL